LKLEDQLLQIINELLLTDTWRSAYKDFLNRKQKMRFVSPKIAFLPQKSFEIDMGKFLSPEVLDRLILDIKEGIYNYAKNNPQKVRDLLRFLSERINTLEQSKEV
jgi:hypothetical protein